MLTLSFGVGSGLVVMGEQVHALVYDSDGVCVLRGEGVDLCRAEEGAGRWQGELILRLPIPRPNPHLRSLT